MKRNTFLKILIAFLLLFILIKRANRRSNNVELLKPEPKPYFGNIANVPVETAMKKVALPHW